jgi:hypothetical protein
MLLQSALSCPKINCSGRHTVSPGHLFSSEQAPGSQSAVAALQIESLADVRNFLQVERLILPGPSSLPIQNICNLTVAVVVQ